MISYFQLEGLTKSYGETILFKDITFGINKDEKVALIAKNGTGKTSLLNIIAGKDTADSGKISFRRDISIGYLDQDPDITDNMTVMEHVLDSSREINSVIRNYEQAILSHDKDLLQKASEKMDHYNAWDYETRIKQILTQLKIRDFDQSVNELSGGQRKRIALAHVLIDGPDLLILDEPTNHLDMEMIEWLEEYIQKSQCTLLMVTHDRYFLDRVCDHIIEIDNNTLYRYDGNYSYYLEKREERVQVMSDNITKANNLFRKELDWIRRMPKARGTKAKYRIDNFYKIKEQASQQIDDRKIDLEIQSKRLGNKVIDCYDLHKKFGEFTAVDSFSYKFARFEKVGVVGKNGIGKSTFLDLLTGLINPDSGYLETGETVHIGYYRQEGIKIKEDQRVIDVIKEISEDIWLGDGRKLSPVQFLDHFLFTTDMQYNYVSKLSGGERRRLYLMTVLMRNPNFLILDEPTNDLDIMTLNILEEYLINFKGCLLVVSHDRYFMDKVCESLFVFEEGGKIKSFPGNYSDYSAWLSDKEKEERKQEKEVKTVREKPVTQTSKKASFKEKQEYEKLEKDLEDLEKEKKSIESLLNSGTLKPQDLTEKSIQITELIKIIEQKEHRWLELNEIVEGN